MHIYYLHNCNLTSKNPRIDSSKFQNIQANNSKMWDDGKWKLSTLTVNNWSHTASKRLSQLRHVGIISEAGNKLKLSQADNKSGPELSLQIFLILFVFMVRSFIGRGWGRMVEHSSGFLGNVLALPGVLGECPTTVVPGKKTKQNTGNMICLYN